MAKLNAFRLNPEVFIHFLTIEELKGKMNDILRSLNRSTDVDLENYVPIGIEYDIVDMEQLLRRHSEKAEDKEQDYVKRGILLQLVLSSKFYGKNIIYYGNIVNISKEWRKNQL